MNLETTIQEIKTKTKDTGINISKEDEIWITQTINDMLEKYGEHFERDDTCIQVIVEEETVLLAFTSVSVGLGAAQVKINILGLFVSEHEWREIGVGNGAFQAGCWIASESSA